MVMITNGSVSHGDGDTIPEVLEEDFFPPNFNEYLLKERLKWSRCEQDFWSEQDHEIEPSLSRDNCADFDPKLFLEKDYFPPNFKEYMRKEQLKWSRHNLVSDFGWVFWGEQDRRIEPSLSLDYWADFNSNVCAIPKVEYNIRHALQKLIQQSGTKFYGCLVQFWAATKTLEGRTKLTTQYQPFALSATWYTIQRQRLCDYRMKMCSSEYNNCFYADAESGEEQLGLPGRVFLHKYPESTPDVKYYSKKEYPQLDVARQCFIKGSWALPVFEHSNQTCVGVLEIVSQFSLASNWHDESFLHNMHDIFQEFGLICLDGYTHCMQCRNGSIKGRRNGNIKGRRNGNIKGRRNAFKELDMVLSDYATAEFLRVAKVSHSRKEGLFERVLASPYMLYYSDITQLSIVEHPFAHYARWCKFSGWFTICLQSSLTEKEVYIVDFFLSTNSMDDENIRTTLSLILGTMEENFETFKLASGQRLGAISLVEVMDFWNGQKLPFVQRIQAPTLATSAELLKNSGLTLQLGQLVQPSTDAIHSGMNVVSEKRNYILRSLGALLDEEATMQLDSPHQPPLDSSNNGHNVVPVEENITSVTSLEEGKRKTQRENKGTGVKIEVSLDDILKCMGMKRKAAAEKLKVSESTFKRACREHAIHRWPPRDIDNFVGRLRPSPVENQGQTSQLNSNLPSNQTVPGVAHMKPRVQDANRVTIRAKYRNKTIKFRLSFSSGLAEFQQEVAKRLHLEAGTYYAEYKDEEGELIIIACDDDLHDCMHTLSSQGNTSIEILLKLEEPLISLVESTRRDPSLFEYIESESKTNVVHYAICHSKTPRRLSMLKSEVADPICHSKYINQFPEGIRNYIVEMKDVQADGNCGFRAIAALIGGDENEWKAIRAAMLEELTSNSSLYEKVAGEKGRTEELYHRLDYFGDGPAPKDKWLTMPDMGHIVASAFKVVLVFLSDKQFLTFLPFYAAPHPSSKRDVEDCVCSMGLVNNDHFVQLYMSPGSPMPPIASNWLNNRQPHAKGWSAPFCSRIKEFRRIIGSDVATRETFDLID